MLRRAAIVAHAVVIGIGTAAVPSHAAETTHPARAETAADPARIP